MSTAVQPARKAVALAYPEPDVRSLPTGVSALTQAPLKVTVKGLVQLPEWKGVFTESAVRALIDKSKTRLSSRGVVRGNGLIEAGAVIRLGRKVLIDVNKFRAWVEGHRVSQITE